jgi:hypothetical protein
MLPGHSLPICMDVLMRSSFCELTAVWGCPECVLSLTTPVTTAEMQHPPPHCAHIHCFVSVNVQQASTSFSRSNFSAWRN